MTTILRPEIGGVVITPNPVSHNQGFLIQVMVSEVQIVLEPIVIYCGTFFCGEDEII